MRWNIEKIGFLHQPEDFLGSFDNDKMQLRHEQQVRLKLEKIKHALDQEKAAFPAMLLLNSRDHVQFLHNNLSAFQADGTLETAVLKLYRKRNGPFSTPSEINTWSDLFRRCSKERLYEQGHQVTFSRATVYRGATIGSARSLSWSPDRERALWYAERWKDPELGGGTLFEVDISRADFLVHLTDKHEEEYILSPDFVESASIRAFVADV